MQLKINYNANQNGYSLESVFDATATNDAEALGYATTVLFKSAEFLAQYCMKRPDLEERIKKGIGKAVGEMQNNPNWPFDTTIVTD